MNPFSFLQTLLIVAALFATMCIVSLVRGKDVKQDLKRNAQVALLLTFGVAVVFGIAGLTRK